MPAQNTVAVDRLLRAVADELEQEGITIAPATLFQDELLAPAGPLNRRRPSAPQLKDIEYGFKVAKEIVEHNAGASTFSDWWAYKVEAYDAVPFSPAT